MLTPIPRAQIKLQFGSIMNNGRLTKPAKVFELHVDGTVLYTVQEPWDVEKLSLREGNGE